MSQPQGAVALWAPAKINLRLEVLGRRPDGYHDIQSIMQQVDLCDRILIHPEKEGIHVCCEGADLPEQEGNLAYKAACLLADRASIKCGVLIHVQKRIPLAAGLGGGSSDAAAVLRGLNTIWDLRLKPADLMQVGRGLGADVPFFLFGPEALATGVGEMLKNLPAPLPAWIYVLVNPRFPVSSAWAYKSLKMELTRPKSGRSINKIFEALYPVDRWLFNDLEVPVSSQYPVIQIIKETLRQLGAEGALMSGSGPTVFGVFSSRSAAVSASDIIRRNYPWDAFIARKWTQERCLIHSC